jgi:glycosyltransferase involved in cell wall biosynthesis
MEKSPPLRPARIVLLLEDLKFGGTQRQALELARGLDRSRFLPEIWSMTRGDDLAPLARSWQVPLVFLSRGGRVGPVSLARLGRRLNQERPDLLLTLTAVPNIWGRILGKMAGLPLIIGNVRGLSYYRQHEGWLWPLADHILCNTRAIQDILHKRCEISPGRISVIPNGVDTAFFQPSPGGSSPEKPVIISVGRLVPDKDQETLISAFALMRQDHPDAELWLVGDGPLLPRLKRLARSLLPADKVQFLAGREDLRPLLAQARLFALSSRKEAFPNVILEAMSMGLPVAATRVGGVPELVAPGETGLLAPPEDPPALAAAMSYLWGDAAAARAWGQAGRARVERDFSLAAMVRRYEEVLADLGENKANGAKRLSPRRRTGFRLGPPSPPLPAALIPERAKTANRAPFAPPAPNPAGPRVAYILLWFPERSETFILDEANTLRRLGLDLRVATLYGARPARQVAGMGEILPPVLRLGLASLPTLILELLRLFQERGPMARQVLAETLVRAWRSLETGGEAVWAALCGVRLARVFKAMGVNHIHGAWATGPATAAWVASRLSGIPFSFCGHAYDIHPPDGALLEKMEAAAFIRVNAAVNRDYLLALAPEAEDKIFLIRNGISLTPAKVPPPPPGPPYHLLAIGRLVPKKGFKVLLEACRDLFTQGLDFRLTLAGDGPQRRELQELARKFGLAPRVSFPGFVPHQKVPELFRQAHLLVMPSVIDPFGNRDGIPNVIMEALVNEVPVVASAVSGIPEVVLPGETGWLAPPNAPQALAQAVMEALSHPGEARSRARAGRELVTREFDSRKNYGELKDCLERFSQ